MPPQDLATLRPEFRAKLMEVFGGEGSPQRAENDVFLLLRRRLRIRIRTSIWLAAQMISLWRRTGRLYCNSPRENARMSITKLPAAIPGSTGTSTLDPMLQALEQVQIDTFGLPMNWRKLRGAISIL